MKSLSAQNYYEILGVSRYASREEIQRAYQLSRQTYQENSLATYSLFSDAENREILDLISQAFETLFNPDLRREYDAFLREQEGEGAGGGEERMVASVIAAREPHPAPAAAAAAAPPREHAPPVADAGVSEGSRRRMDELLREADGFSGHVLQRVRNVLGITLDELAQQTKIRRTYLEYLESEQFDALPAEVYVKGFVTIVANTLRLPTPQTVDEYMHRYREQKHAAGQAG